jgi:hypothetical protein
MFLKLRKMKSHDASPKTVKQPRPMTEAQIEAAAHADPDARPMTDQEFAAARRVPRDKILRRAMRLMQAEPPS